MTNIKWVVFSILFVVLMAFVSYRSYRAGLNGSGSVIDKSPVEVKTQGVQTQSLNTPPQVVTPMTRQDNDKLAKKMAVATYYQLELERMYGRALVSIDNTDEDIIQVSMVNIPDDRRNAILDSGLYEKAKGAKFKRIRFIDATQNKTYITIQ